MRSFLRLIGVMGFGAICFAAFNNFSSVDLSSRDAKTGESFHSNTKDNSKKEYVKIEGKFYEKNARGIYNVDGVPTMVKSAPVRPAKQVAKADADDPTLGPPIDPRIYKRAMGLPENDEFFKPRTDDSSDQ